MAKLSFKDFSDCSSKDAVKNLGGTPPTSQNTILTITRERIADPNTDRIISIYSLFQGDEYLFSIPVEPDKATIERIREYKKLEDYFNFTSVEKEAFANHCMIKNLLKQMASSYEGMIEKPERMNVRRIRKILKFTMADVAEFMKSSAAYVSRIETDKYISYKTLFKFCSTLMSMQNAKIIRAKQAKTQVQNQAAQDKTENQAAQDKAQDQNQTTQPQDDRDDRDSQDSQYNLDDILSDEAIDKLFGK